MVPKICHLEFRYIQELPPWSQDFPRPVLLEAKMASSPSSPSTWNQVGAKTWQLDTGLSSDPHSAARIAQGYPKIPFKKLQARVRQVFKNSATSRLDAAAFFQFNNHHFFKTAKRANLTPNWSFQPLQSFIKLMKTCSHQCGIESNRKKAGIIH